MRRVKGKMVIKPNDVQRMLVVLPTWVGDCVMATPVLRSLRERFSSAEITFLCVPNLVDLISSGDWMDNWVTWPPKNRRNHPLALWRLISELRSRTFDLAVLLPNSFRSALVARLCGATHRVVYARDNRAFLLTHTLSPPIQNGRVTPHPICSYYGRIAETLGCDRPGDALELFTDAESDASVTRRLAALGIESHHPLVVFSPGASFGASKLWMPERFARLGDRLIASEGATVLITCGPGEEHIAQMLGREMYQTAHVMDNPRVTLRELISLLKRCDLLVINDTGPRHIAKAFGVPIVTIFGPTHQEWTDTDYPMERKIQIEIDCGPCQKKVCPLGHLDCMKGVTVDMVYQQCVDLLHAQNQTLAR